MDERSQPFRKGDKVGDYVILRLIGKGGQGFVYEGVHEWAGNAVAVKAIPSAVDAATNVSERAKTEARILVNLNHANILRVHTATATNDGVVCIVTELLKGRSLRMLLREINRVRVDEALLIGAQVAEGAQAAHDFGVIHRDLKPENVYIEPGNIVKVLDFGIAKITGPGAITTQENLIKGTLQYMSPEQLQARALTPGSDIFALGCILYELLSGSTPVLTGAPQTVNEAGWMQISHMPPQLNTVCDEIPPYVAHAVQLLLAKEPADRPASMSQVATDLRALYARYTKKAGCTPRELWHDGLDAASPLEFHPVRAPVVTTTVGHGEPTISGRGLVASLVRNANIERASAGPALAIAVLPTAASESQLQVVSDSRVRAAVAEREPSAASQSSQQTPGTAVPVSAAARGTPPAIIQWHKIGAAVGTGALLGVAALLLVRWTAIDHRASATDATAKPAPSAVSALASGVLAPRVRATALPPAADIPRRDASVTATPTASVPIAWPQPQRVTQSGSPATISSVPPEPRTATSTKSTPRKTKSSAGKLPFGPDDLIF